MPARKTGTTKRTTAKKTGRSAKAMGGAELTPLPRSARQVANAIWARARRNPKFWADVQECMWGLIGANDRGTGRVAPAQPCESAATH